MEALPSISGHFYAGDLNQISQLFEQPQKASDWEKYLLPAWQVDFFEQNGFISGIQLLDEVTADHLNHLLRTRSLDISAAEILIHSPAYRMAAYQLLGKSFRLFQKFTTSESVYEVEGSPWQQDFDYWQSAMPMRHLSCQVALETVDEGNGCTYYVPGSHRFGLLPISTATCSMEVIKSVLTPAQLAIFEENCPSLLKKGCASFHHPLTLHGTYACIGEKAGRVAGLNITDPQNKQFIPEDTSSIPFYNFPAHSLLGETPNHAALAPSNSPFFDGDKEFWDLGLTVPKVNFKKMYTLQMLHPS